MEHEAKNVSRRKRGGGESGQHLVEFALVLLPLALILFGICQYGLIYDANMTIRNATVAAARYAVLSVTNAPTIVQIQSFAKQVVTADPFLKTNYVAAVNVNTNVTVGGVNGATSVQIQYNLPLIIPWVVPGMSAGSSVSLSATTIMR
jgi:Flp pilus assembly protein TadG